MQSDAATSEPRVISEGRPASYWVAQFAESGSKVSERRLKELARKLGCYIPHTSPILILPEHIDRIFLREPTCRSNSNSGEKSGTLKAVSMNSPKATTIEEAREELKKRCANVLRVVQKKRN